MVNNKLSFKGKRYLASSGLLISGSILMSSLLGCGETETTTKLNPTQGVITEIEEMRNGEYLITNETIVSRKEDSRVIASYLDGTRDTLTMAEARLEDSGSSSSSTTTHRSGMNNVLMGGMMGYMMGKSMSTPVSRGAYRNTTSYNRSNTSTNTLRSSATRQTISRPRTGFGSGGGSTRSSGG